MVKANANNPNQELLISDNILQERIFNIRGMQVMIDRDLAELYGVETKAINQAVKRNIDRFPQDFRFQLTTQEKNELVAICDRCEKLMHAIETANALRYRKLRYLNQKSFNITNCDLH